MLPCSRVVDSAVGVGRAMPRHADVSVANEMTTKHTITSVSTQL